MNRHILVLISAFTVAAAGKVGAIDLNRPTGEQEQEHPPSVGAATSGAAGEQEQEKAQNYTCPMHPEVVTDHSGNCPKCGMKLVPLAEKKRSIPIDREQAPNAQRPIIRPIRRIRPTRPP